MLINVKFQGKTISCPSIRALRSFHFFKQKNTSGKHKILGITNNNNTNHENNNTD